ncbi:hypothetical protein [Actinoalloteichus sp. AHMU CJ021]|uniref:hypothetical protein n=1 Tax=Actinoalloteichus sp. AHMU CJ021 TaxID=2072503 RepID=UPI00307B5A07
MTPTVAAAESALSRRFGAPVRLGDPEDLGGSGRAVVIRVRVVENPFSLPRSLVIKHYQGPAPEAAADPFAHEAASCQLLTALPSETWVGPELVGQDASERLVILEDLGRAPTLTDRLEGSDTRAAETALLAWARGLGRLHASTAGREADFDTLVRRLGGLEPARPAAVEDSERMLAELPTLLAETVGVDTPDAVLAELGEEVRLFARGRYRAFSPSEICPDNSVVTSSGVRFLDFEGGCMRDIALDAVNLSVPFASCWCGSAIPARMSQAMLAAWRSEVSAVWPELDDDAVLMPWLLRAQLLWAWLTTWKLLGIANERSADVPAANDHGDPILRYLTLLTQWERLAGDERLSPTMREHADQVAEGIRAHFGLKTQQLPTYPAFR